MAFTFGATKNAKDTDMDFEPLKPGNYEFQIEKVTIQPFAGSDKINPCNKLHIQLRTDLDGAHSRKVWDDICLDASHDYSMNKLSKLVHNAAFELSGGGAGIGDDEKTIHILALAYSLHEPCGYYPCFAAACPGGDQNCAAPAVNGLLLAVCGVKLRHLLRLLPVLPRPGRC